MKIGAREEPVGHFQERAAAGVAETCGTLVRSSKIRGSPHKPRGPALQNKKHLIALRRASEPRTLVARCFERSYHAARVSKRSGGCILLNSLQFEQATLRNGLID